MAVIYPSLFFPLRPSFLISFFLVPSFLISFKTLMEDQIMHIVLAKLIYCSILKTHPAQTMAYLQLFTFSPIELLVPDEH